MARPIKHKTTMPTVFVGIYPSGRTLNFFDAGAHTALDEPSADVMIRCVRANRTAWQGAVPDNGPVSTTEGMPQPLVMFLSSESTCRGGTLHSFHDFC